ncbi:hypothetical protein [Granulicoccus phenolivorans]|uniref:hypothetical protein n=1 Tax=Granulicoccus phenolivorans TaxID=266854 RepID=UPI0003FCDC76|nr:hypothetical protein [Granulicoccus phenolivorans]
MGHDPFDFGNAPASHPSPGGGSPFGGAGPSSYPSAPRTGDPFATQTRPGTPDPFATVGAPRQADAGVFAAGGGVAVAPTAGITVTKPPAYLLLIAAGLALVAGVVALLLNNPIVAIVCWVVAGPIAIGVIAYFVIRDTYARSSGVYGAPNWVKPLYYTAIALCLVCILVPAVRIALWVGTL